MVYTRRCFSTSYGFFFFFFFFQAEDGIRDWSVTGVQMCALPILVNTCAVTAEAVRKARQEIRRLRRQNPQARLIVTDRKSVVEGKSVDLGGRRIIKKKKKKR